jgi:hypothetical protein
MTAKTSLLRLIDANVNLYSTYAVTNLNQNANSALFLQDVAGLPRQLQVGYPYTARLNVFSAGVDFGVGDVRARPYYRQVYSQSQAILLPGSLPSFTDDSRLNLGQLAYGLRLDLPAWEGTSLGVGWERQTWTDFVRSLNNGVVNLYTVNFSTRY